MTKGGSTYCLTFDQLGSLRVVADASGNVVKRTNYDSFGNIIDDTDPSFEVPFGFDGGLHDRDRGLVQFGFRDYDPDIGRWTAKDEKNVLMCSMCIKPYHKKDCQDLKCPVCQALLEDLSGFYERHPELRK